MDSKPKPPRKSMALVSALLAALALSAVLIAPASALGTVPLWHTNGSKLAQGTPLPITMKATIKFVLGWTVGEKGVTLSCKTMSSTNSNVENPVGGAAGKFQARLIFGECTASAAGVACVVNQSEGKKGVVETSATPIVGTGFQVEGLPGIQTGPTSSPWFSVNLTCNPPMEGFSGKHEIEATKLGGLVSGSTFKFQRAYSQLKSKFHEFTGTGFMEGSSQMELGNGEALSLVIS
jgi:hypothetical protein